MFRMISVGSMVLFATAAVAQQGPKGPVDQAKLEKCRQLAKQRGFDSGIQGAKGANNMKSFVIACMQGKQS